MPNSSGVCLLVASDAFILRQNRAISLPSCAAIGSNDAEFRLIQHGHLRFASPAPKQFHVPHSTAAISHLSATTSCLRLESSNLLGPIGSIDAYILRGEVAGPVAGPGFSRVQIYDQRNVFAEKFVAGGTLVEIKRLAAPQYGNARHLDIHKCG